MKLPFQEPHNLYNQSAQIIVNKMSKDNPYDKPTIESRLATRGAKWHRDAPDIIPLWLADPDYPLCPELKDEMRKVIEEEYTIVRKTHLARPGVLASSNQTGIGNGMMGRLEGPYGYQAVPFGH